MASHFRLARLLLSSWGLSAALRHSERRASDHGAPKTDAEKKRRVVIENATASDPFERTYHYDDWQSGSEKDVLNLQDPVCVTSVGSPKQRCKLLSQKLCRSDSSRLSRMDDTKAVGGPDGLMCFQHRRTCAVVGSSQHLLNATWGASIDRHDLVIRINGAPAGSNDPASERSAYASSVGTRTDVRFVNGAGHIPKVPESSGPVCLFLHEPQAPDECGTGCWRNPGFCNVTCRADKPSQRPFCTKKRCDLDKFRCRAVRMPQREEPDWGDNHVFLDSFYAGIVDQVVPHSTAGFKAVVYAMSICDKVTVVGFGPTCAGSIGDKYYKTEGGGILAWHHYEEELGLLFRADRLGTKALIPPEARKWIAAKEVRVMVPGCVDKAAVSRLNQLFEPFGDSTFVNLVYGPGGRYLDDGAADGLGE